jgi:hypothetical protein
LRFRVAKFASHTISLLDKSTPLEAVAGAAGSAGIEDAHAACSSSPIRRVGVISTSEALSIPTTFVQRVSEEAAEEAAEEEEEEVLHQERAHKCTANTPAPLNYTFQYMPFNILVPANLSKLERTSVSVYPTTAPAAATTTSSVHVAVDTYVYIDR